MNTNGRKCARLLSKLDTDDLQLIVSSDSFDIAILQHCFALGAHLSLKVIINQSFSQIKHNVHLEKKNQP